MESDRQVQALHGIAHAAIQDWPLRDFLQRVVDEVRESFHWEYVGIARVDQREHVAILESFSTDLPFALKRGDRQSLDTGIVGQVTRSGRYRFEPQTERSTEYVPTVPQICAELCLPVIQGETVVAVLNVESHSADALRGQAAFLETVCDLVAGAMVNLERVEIQRRQTALMEVTTAVSRLAMRGERLDEMLRLTVNYMAAHLPVTVASILMLNETGTHFSYEVMAGELTLYAPDDWPVSVGVCGRCARTGQPQWVDDVHRDPDYVPGHVDVESEYLVPIAWQDRVLGVLNLESVEAGTFTEEVQTVFQGIAAQIAGIIHLLGVRHDLEDSNRRLDRLTRLDGLTGVANRREFDAVLASEWSKGWANGPLCTAMVDIDYFKPLNDTHGHLYGDDCLVRVAQAIAGVIPDDRFLVARYGGEEFGLVLPGIGLEEAAALAELICRVTRELALENQGAPGDRIVTVSVGVSERRDDDAGYQTLLERADDALYQAKHQGRNRAVAGTIGNCP